MSTAPPPQASPYQLLLGVARSLGRSDGGLAAQVEPADLVGPPSTYCWGRAPEEFARLLWADRPGAPPSGLQLNAPLWYAHGFAEGLAAERRRPEPAEAGRTTDPLPSPRTGQQREQGRPRPGPAPSGRLPRPRPGSGPGLAKGGGDGALPR